MALQHKVSWSFGSGTNPSASMEIRGVIIIEITACPSGATVTIQHSTDDGATWTTAAGDAAGSGASYTAPRVLVLEMPVSGVRTRVLVTGTFTGNCTGNFGY